MEDITPKTGTRLLNIACSAGSDLRDAFNVEEIAYHCGEQGQIQYP